MRILVISRLYPPVVHGGYEQQCAATVQSLAQFHDVLVLTTDIDSGMVQSDPATRRTLPSISYTSKFEAARCFIDTPRAVRDVRSVLKSFKPEVVNVWQASGMPHATLAELLEWEVPVVLTIGDYWPATLNQSDPYMRSLTSPRRSAATIAVRAHNRLWPGMKLRVTTRRPVGAIWVSEYMRTHVEMPGTMQVCAETVILPPSSSLSIYQGVGATASGHGSVGNPTLLFAGRVVEEKGPQFLLGCAAELLSAYPSLTVRIAGAYAPEVGAELKALGARVGLPPDQLQLLGMLSPEQLALEFAAASVFVMPSLWPEPAGIALLDAAAAEVPVVASSAGGMPEMLRADLDALFFTPGDQQGCVAAIHATISDRRGTAARVRSAKARALSLAAAYDPEYRGFLESASDALPIRAG